jgi:predicted RNase H-like HicB family nuclease
MEAVVEYDLSLIGGFIMQLTLVLERETDGRWLAEVPELPGLLVYGSSEAEAMAKAEAMAFRVLAERIEHGEAAPFPVKFTLPTAA